MRTTVHRLRRLPGLSTSRGRMAAHGLAPMPAMPDAPTDRIGDARAEGLARGRTSMAAVGSAVHAQRTHQRLLGKQLAELAAEGLASEADRRTVRLGRLVLDVVNAAIHHSRATTPRSLERLRTAVQAPTRRVPA